MASLKEWIEQHPAAVIFAVAISVGSTAAGVTSFLLKQTSDAEKLQITNKFNGQIADLTNRLSSIERRAGPNQKNYLDVQSIQISPQEIRNLPAQYRNFDSGRFFVNVPVSDSWDYSIMTEGDANKLGPFKAFIEAIENIPTDAAKKLLGTKLYTWHAKSIAEISYDFGYEPSKTHVTGSLTPSVWMMKISRTDILEKQKALLGLLSGALNGSVQKKQQIENVNTLESKASIDHADTTSGINNESISSIKNSLERLFDGDTAGFIFVDRLSSMMQMSMLSPTISLSILSAQKQLNVMYLDVELRISEAAISKASAESCANGSKTTVILRRELFFVSYGEDGFLIQTEVPTCDGRSKAFDWISQWLAGLKIAVRGVS